MADMNFGVDLLPVSNQSNKLGSSSKKWDDIYVDKINNKNIIDIVYPVGSIYMSVTSTSPAVLFGGTWEQLENRFLIGAGTNHAAGATGGSATHTLTTSEMPSHNHTFTGNEVDTGENSVGHTHTYTDYYATTTGGTAISVAQMPSHTHTSKGRYSSNGSERYELIPWSDSGNSWSNKNMVASTGSTNSHTHTGNNTSTTRTSDDVSDNHTHKVTAIGTIGNSGSGDAFSIIPPYLAVYMWKRTA